MNCSIQCNLIGGGIQAAAKAAGWRYKAISYNSVDTSSLVSGMQQALQDHPAAVAIAGPPEPAWASLLTAYKAAGVPIIADDVAPATVDGTVITSINGAAQQTTYGQQLADWFIADSKGKGNALVMTSNDIGIFASNSDGFQATVKSKCPACKVTVDNVSLAVTNSGGLGSAAVSELQRDSSINYVFSVDGPFFTGLATQLKSLGLSRVKIGGLEATNSDLTNVRAGTEAVWLVASTTETGWTIMDAAFRHVEGMAMDPNEALDPEQLLTQGSSFTISDSYDLPTDYPAAYEKLWKL